MAVESEVTGKTYQPAAAMAAEALTGIVFLDPDELVVEHWADGATSGTVLARDADYSIGGEGATGSGTITALAVWPANDQFRIYRDGGPALQPEVFSRHAPLSAKDIERGLDRMALRMQELRRELARTPQFPRGSTPVDFAELADLADGDLLEFRDGQLQRFDHAAIAGKYVAGDAEGHLVGSAGTGGADENLRTDMAAADGSGAALSGYKQDSAPAILRSVRSRLRDFKLTSDVCAMNGIADDWPNFFAFAQQISDDGGGRIWLPGKHSTLLFKTALAQLPPKVRLSLEGGRLLQRLSVSGTGYDPGLRWSSGCGIEHGIIEMDSTPAGLGSQFAHHSCLVAGPMYGEGGTYLAPSPLHDTEDFYFRDLEFVSNAVGRGCIALIGGVHDYEISNVRVKDPATLAAIAGVVNADWGTVGDVQMGPGEGDPAATLAAIEATRTQYDLGRAWTMHPHSGSIDKIFVDEMSHADSDVVRLSGTYGVTVSRVEAKGVRRSCITITGGDCGPEFMLDSEVSRAGKGLVVEEVTCLDCNNGIGLRADQRGDNVHLAVNEGYVALRGTTMNTNLAIRDNTFIAAGGAGVTDGISISYMTGGRTENNTVRGFRSGIAQGNGVTAFISENNETSFNRQYGEVVNGLTDKPSRCQVIRPRSFFNGQADDGAGNKYAQVALISASRCEVHAGDIGNPTGGAENASFGILLATTGAGGDLNRITGNPMVHAHKAGGAALLIGSDEDFGSCGLYAGASFGAGVTTPYSGLSIVPMTLNPRTGDPLDLLAHVAKLGVGGEPPATFPGKAGQRIRISDPASAGFEGSRCIAAGAPGTWELYGASTP